MKHQHRTEHDCLNCGATLQGHFCHVCGQENLQLNDNFGHIMAHAIGDYFHFDHKLIHTLKPLLFKPGKLTVDYLAGKRTQYLDPIKMYIFISLVYFLLLFGHNSEQKKAEQKKINKAQVLDSVKRVINKDMDLSPAQKIEAEKKIDLAVDKGKTFTDRVAWKNEDDSDTSFDVTPLIHVNAKDKSKDTTYTQYLQSQQKLDPKDRDGFTSRFFTKKNLEWKSKKISPKEAIKEGLTHNFPKFMFLLLPLFAFLLRFAFWKNHKFYVEHLIYSFHLHCFVFLFLAVVMLVKLVVPNSWVTFNDYLYWITTILILFYIYKSLRVIYHRSRFRTVTKMIGVSIMYSMVFSISLLLFLIVTALLT